MRIPPVRRVRDPRPQTQNARDDGGLDRGAGDAVLRCALTVPAFTHENVRAEACAKTERAESRDNRRAIKRETGVEDSSVRISCPLDARFPDQHPSIAIWKPI